MPSSQQFYELCTKCKAFCCTIYRPPVTETEKDAIIEAGFKNCFIKVGNGVYDIVEEDNGKCPYLMNDYSCKIQHVKPMLCKTWPIIPRYKNNKRDCIVVKCPLFPFLSNKDIQQAKEEAEKMPLSLVKHLWNIPQEIRNKFKKYEYVKI